MEIWDALGYDIPSGPDGFMAPGLLVRKYRVQQGLTQEQLANELGITRGMVSRMETQNDGLDSIVTRRELAKLLGIAPLLLGIVSIDDIAKKTVYSTQHLRSTLQAYDEVYHTSNSIGLDAVVGTIKGIQTLSEDNSHKDREILAILAEFGILAIKIATEQNNSKVTQKYIKWTLNLVRELQDPILLSRTLARTSFELYTQGDTKGAQKYAQEAYAIKNIPSYNRGMMLVDYGRAMGDTKAVDEAVRIASRINSPKLSTSFALLRQATVLVDNKEYDAALNILDEAENTAPPAYLRRKALIHLRQAEALIGTGEFEEATSVAVSALTLAKTVTSQPIIRQISSIHASLKSSPYGNSRPVARLGHGL